MQTTCRLHMERVGMQVKLPERCKHLAYGFAFDWSALWAQMVVDPARVDVKPPKTFGWSLALAFLKPKCTKLAEANCSFTNRSATKVNQKSFLVWSLVFFNAFCNTCGDVAWCGYLSFMFPVHFRWCLRTQQLQDWPSLKTDDAIKSIPLGCLKTASNNNGNVPFVYCSWSLGCSRNLQIWKNTKQMQETCVRKAHPE